MKEQNNKYYLIVQKWHYDSNPSLISSRLFKTKESAIKNFLNKDLRAKNLKTDLEREEYLKNNYKHIQIKELEIVF